MSEAVKRYRCKRAVEAMRWVDTDENREAFANWFEQHDAIFETRGPVVILPDDGALAVEGSWIVYDDCHFQAVPDVLFCHDYEEVTP